MLNRLAQRAVLLLALVSLGALLAVAGTARGAGARQQAAAVDLTQTCSTRVQPRSRIDVHGELANTGDVVIDSVSVDADAGTPDDTSDDFIPTYVSGDTSNPGQLDPGERWVYSGSYAAPTEDVIDTMNMDGVPVGGGDVSDIAPCETDVAQRPEPGTIAGVRPVSGHVFVKKPGTNTFVELKGPTEIPIGSQVDTTRGTISITAGLGGGRTNTSQFFDGLFTIFQKRARNAYMTLRLDGGNFRICARRSLTTLGADVKRKKPVRRLWGSGRGRFTTRGRYSSATVRGTKWLTQDQCNGTLTRVVRGVVRVVDFRRHKTVNVRAGRSYLAKAPGA
jgi:hypothetical protein